jgi:hypothetical protein
VTGLPGRQFRLRGTEGAGTQLKAQIPWFCVFVEGVVIVGKLKH